MTVNGKSVSGIIAVVIGVLATMGLTGATWVSLNREVSANTTKIALTCDRLNNTEADMKRFMEIHADIAVMRTKLEIIERKVDKLAESK